MRNNRLFLTVLFLLSGFTRNLSADDLAWPTDASRLIAGTFCEYRPGHFHAGIDIRTWGQEGYKAFAIDSGSVVRIQVSPFGYGRAVYFRTVGSLTAVYAHLSRFNDALEKRVREEQLRQGYFAVDFSLDPGELAFGKGDILAYTGATGTNSPHLHFEIRDAMNRPVNPYFNYRVEDHIPPRIRAVALSPLNYASHVGGDFKPKTRRVRTVGPGKYRLDEVLTGWGELGLSVSVSDLSDGSGNRLAAYALTLWIDSTRVFHSQYDRFPYALTRQIAIQRDSRLLADQKGEFQRLYRTEGNSLGFYEPDFSRLGVLVGGAWEVPPLLDDGRTPLLTGDHAFRIIVSDYWGNQSELTGALRMSPLLLSQADPVRPGYSRPAPLVEADSIPARIEMQFYDDYLRFEVTGRSLSESNTRLFVGDGANHRSPVPLVRVASNVYAGTYSLQSVSDGWMTVEAVSPSEGLIAEPLQVPVFHASGAGQDDWTSRDHLFRVRFQAGSVFSPVWGTVSADSLSFPAASLAYRVIPDETPLDEPVLVQFAGLDLSDTLLAVYRVPEYGKPVFAGKEIMNGYLGARTRVLGRFAVIKDTVPPEILHVRPLDGTVFQSRKPRLSAAFRDGLSGIGGEDDYVFRLDGERLIVEYDPRKSMAFYPYPTELAAGDHVLFIEIRDRAGNVTVRQTRFKILPN